MLQNLPAGTWWSFLYCSCFNILNLLLCIVGAELFGKTSILILTMVSTFAFIIEII
jgi:potassium/chloride transporter 9